MNQIRKGVFETNSSSTHSLVISSKDEIDKWISGELYYLTWYPNQMRLAGIAKKDFYTKEEVEDICRMLDWDDNYRMDALVTFDEYSSFLSLEISMYEYTTAGGEKIKAVARYGYDG